MTDTKTSTGEFLRTFLLRPMTMTKLKMGPPVKCTINVGDSYRDDYVGMYSPKATLEAQFENREDSPGRHLGADVKQFMEGMEKCLVEAPLGDIPSWADNQTRHDYDHKVWLTSTEEESKVKPVKWLRTAHMKHSYASPKVNLGCVDKQGIYWNIIYNRSYPADEKERQASTAEYSQFQKKIGDLWVKTLQ